MYSICRTSLASLVQRALVRPISTTGQRLASGDNIYKIQSSQEFEDKVKNIQGPVIVDFFATYVTPV